MREREKEEVIEREIEREEVVEREQEEVIEREIERVEVVERKREREREGRSD